jgi:hypothetical protein
MIEPMDREYEFDPRLIDLHLGALQDAQRARVLEEIAADAELTRQHEMLTAVFAALAAAQPVSAPGGLLERVRMRTRRAAGSRAVPPGVVSADAESDDAMGRAALLLRFSNIRDIVAIAAMIVLAVGVGFPSLLHVRERNQRMGCSFNLARVGQGIQAYATTYRAAIPFAGWRPGQSVWRPSSDPSSRAVPNRTHIYRLLSDRIVTEPRLFVCPSRMDVPMPPGEIDRSDSFLESRNISYAYFNMAGVRPTQSDDPELVILADDNPLFEDGLPLFDLRRLRPGPPSAANSRAHRGDGQNVLTLDGRVKWTLTPLCGVGGDNIWELQGVREYTGREGPATATDSHLLK